MDKIDICSSVIGKVFANYFDEETVSKLSGKVYYEEETDDLFLNDNITFVKKNQTAILFRFRIFLQY